MRISDWSSDVCSSDLIELQKFIGCEPRFLEPAGLAVYRRHKAPVREVRARPLAPRGIGRLLVSPLPQRCKCKGQARSDRYPPIQPNGLVDETDSYLQVAG